MKILALLASVIAGVVATAAWAQSAQSGHNPVDALRACRGISDNESRLQCYDQIEADAATPSANSTDVQTTPAVSDIERATIAKEDFGLQKNEAEPEQIQSTIVGTFKGWRKGEILKLANGQRWQVTSQDRGYTRLENPVVTISKGAFSSFNMTVEGLNAMAKVRRID